MRSYPLTIENGAGERLTFTRRIPEPGGDRLEGENIVAPGAGPPMHVHYLQEEGFTVVQGRIGYQRAGREPEFADAGESVVFAAGEAHRFWNAGDSVLRCTAWIKPAGNADYFLEAVFESQKNNGGRRPSLIDMAWLLRRYRTEFGMLAIPAPVQRLLFPVLVGLGKVLGRYTKYADAPEPITARTLRRTLAVSLVAVSLAACAPAGAGPADDSGGSFWSHRFGMQEDLSYGDDPAQKLDLYLQGMPVGEPVWFERASDMRSTLLFIHGGGWLYGDKTGSDPFFLPFLERGWHVVNMTYRLGRGTAPAAVDDALCALRWVADNAAEYGFDRDRIVLAGGSAGGHLALMAGIRGARDGHPCHQRGGFKVAAVISWFGITDIGTLNEYLESTQPHVNYALAWAGDIERLVEMSGELSPLRLVDAAAPPVLTIHGDRDTIVPHEQATAFHDRLEELGVRNELITLSGGNHGGFSDQQYQHAFRSIFSFLERVVR